MKQRDYTTLMSKLAEAYAKHAPKSAKLHEQALKYLIDGGSHSLRLLQPFSPRIVSAQGAWLKDEDGHRILDFWQGHAGNILGHNPKVVTSALAQAFTKGYGLQTGFTDRLQIEAAKILCEQTGAERVRFTTSGTLSTMYAIIMARAFTGRNLVLKIGGGWHGANPWTLKGVRYHQGFESVDSAGIPKAVTDDIIVTGFNNLEMLREHFRKYGSKLACFILEPVIGAGGLMPAKTEYIKTARRLTSQHNVLLIMDEVISGFRYRAGSVAQLYDIKPDLTCLGKAIGGGMPVAAVAGRADILDLVAVDRPDKVNFSGGTFSGHPASMLAAKTFMAHVVKNEEKIYATLAETAIKTRQIVTKAFAEEGLSVRFAGDRSNVLPGNSLHMLLFPRKKDQQLMTPEEIYNPAVCDTILSNKVLQLALLLENVFTVHGLCSTTTAHTDQDIEFFGQACRRAAKRFKPYL
ncbi:MAG: aspartate aminotransferase family protein [Planctomycetota bacterium]|jgi:glutamate-1-semialdehyde 2,1-aminomutase